MNKMKRFLLPMIFTVIVLVIISSCGSLFTTYTVEVQSYIDGTFVWIQYRESGTTEWTDADLYDEYGDEVLWLAYNYGSGDYLDEAYFDLPGPGTYDFRGIDILSELEGDGIISDCVVDLDLGEGADYYLTISDSSSLHGFY